jgi:hypothetical protein
MRAKITITQDDSVAEMLELLRGRRSLKTIAQFLIAGVNEGSLILSGYIAKERLTGNGPFPVSHQRLGTGKHLGGSLRRRFDFAKARFSGDKLTTTVGSTVKYFARHEFGGQGAQERVRAHGVKEHKVRNFMGTGETKTIKAHTRKAFVRTDHTPARQPVRAGIKEHGVRAYGVSIEKRLRQALEGKKL